MNLSRSTIRQLVAHAVINGIIEQVPVSYKLAGEKMPVQAVKLVARAWKDCDDIRNKIEARNRIEVKDGIMQMQPDEFRRYEKKYQAVRAVFNQPGRETMPASQAVTSAMAIAAAMKDEAPDFDRKMDWNSLENHLTDLYQYYDPDMADTEAMEQGVRDCEALMRITA